MGRKVIVALCAMIMLGVAAPVVAEDEATGRVVRIPYEGPNTFNESLGVYHDRADQEARPRSGERFVAAQVNDLSGRPVLAAIHQGSRALAPDFCGEAPGPMRLHGRRSVHVHIYFDQGCGGISLPIQGEVVLTFR